MFARAVRPVGAASSWARFRCASFAQAGQGLVEYSLILIIVSIVAIFLIVSMGGRLNSMFSNVVVALGGQ